MTESAPTARKLGIACPVCGHNNPPPESGEAPLRCARCGVGAGTMNMVVQLIDEAERGRAFVLRPHEYGVDFGERRILDWVGDAALAKVLKLHRGYREMAATTDAAGSPNLASSLAAVEDSAADFILFRDAFAAVADIGALLDQCVRICRPGGAVFFEERLPPSRAASVAGASDGTGGRGAAIGRSGAAQAPRSPFPGHALAGLRGRGFVLHWGRTTVPPELFGSATLTAQKP